MSRKVKVATISFLFGNEPVTKDDRYDQALRYLEAAAQDAPDLILLPELFETIGCREWQEVRRIRDAAERFSAALEFAEAEDGPFARRLQAFAETHRLVVVSNTLTRSGDRLFNQATFYGRQGEILGRYRKVQPTENEYEEVGISAGDEIRPIEVDGVRYGVFICNDQAFP